MIGKVAGRLFPNTAEANVFRVDRRSRFFFGESTTIFYILNSIHMRILAYKKAKARPGILKGVI